MSNVYNYFLADLKSGTLHINRTLSRQNADGSLEALVEFKEKVMLDIDGYSRYTAFYIPETEYNDYCCIELLKNYQQIKDYSEKVEITGISKGDIQLGVPNVTYTNKIYFYLESDLSKEAYDQIDAFSKSKNYFVTIRSKKYVEERMKSDKPLAFISHDHNDKEQIARPLADGLRSRLCSVWYDEYSLKVGDSLRESIEKGIKDARKCVLVITPHFLQNPGWGKAEFNAIFTKQIIFEKRIVLPIWYGVNKQQVYDYSPQLVDTFALTWPDPSKTSDEEYKKNKEILISRLHAKIVED